MIDVYSWPTPNGHKVHIMLEECGLPYRAHAVDIGAGDQFKPEFLRISPNNKIPAIVDDEGPDGKPISMFESGGDPDLPGGQDGALPANRRARPVHGAAVADVPDGRRRSDARTGTSLPPVCAGEDRVRDQPLHQRGPALYGVMDRRLEQAPYFAGEYSIADIATYPWTRSHANQASIWPSFPISVAGTRPSARARRSSAAYRYWPTDASQSPTTRRATCCSARPSTRSDER